VFETAECQVCCWFFFQLPTDVFNSDLYKSFFRYDSVTAILWDLQLLSFDTLLYNYKFSFSMQFTCNRNAV